MISKKASTDDKISGITTNPTLMAKAGVVDYYGFCEKVLGIIGEKSFSVEIFADEPDEIIDQSYILNKLGRNVYVKIPIVNSKGISTLPIINKLSNEGIKINVTAVFTYEQIFETCRNLSSRSDAYISIFAGRIADTGRDPEPYIKFCSEIKKQNHEIIWASPREVFNIVQAERSGAEIITATPELINKTLNFNKCLHQYSVETSKMFYDDAVASKFSII